MNLENEKAIKNYLGRKTMFKFVCYTEGIVAYESVTLVKTHNHTLEKVELYLNFHGEDILNYDTVEGLLSTFEVSEVGLINENLTSETIFIR